MTLAASSYNHGGSARTLCRSLQGLALVLYEVSALIGAGGMGEVYKARDTRLDRTVAIKVLPREVAGDPDSRARFEREARAVAALDHPHICGIYDVGSVDGTHYLVMPYLDGQTLAARLEKGPLPLDQALTIAVEIADALDKAHRAGHRPSRPQARQHHADQGRRRSCSTSGWRSCGRAGRRSRCRG